MHLRITEEAEMNGIDSDQFFDEQIGDWGVFDELNRRRLDIELTAPGTPRVQEITGETSSDDAEKKV